MSKPTITAYLKPWCGWSAGVRAVFKKYDLSFQEKDIINHPENFDEMVQKTGQTKQPTVEINGQILADVSGEEVEAWMLRNRIVSENGIVPEVPINQPCAHELPQAQQAAPMTFKR
jgi:monothiol glutaredoxin